MGTEKTASNTASEHARSHDARPPPRGKGWERGGSGVIHFDSNIFVVVEELLRLFFGAGVK